MLSDSYHVLVLDYPGFGLTKISDDFVFTFEKLTSVMAAWLRALDVSEAAIYTLDIDVTVELRLVLPKGV